MIIYEKENKLNINFDNSTEAQPDVEISKEDGQVVIEAGGQPIGGSSSGGMTVEFEWVPASGSADPYFKSKVPASTVADAYKNGQSVVFYFPDDPTGRTNSYGLGIYGGYTNLVALYERAGTENEGFVFEYYRSGAMNNVFNESDPVDLNDSSALIIFKVYID